MPEMVVRRRSENILFLKILKIHREKPVIEFLSNKDTGLQTVRFSTLLKRDPLIGVSEPVVCR